MHFDVIMLMLQLQVSIVLMAHRGAQIFNCDFTDSIDS
jgi:hypothetical protein